MTTTSRVEAAPPRQWCSPASTFGALTDRNGEPIKERVWLLPPERDPVAMAKFRAAVMQHVTCLWVRRAKNFKVHGENNDKALTQEGLALLDKRPDSVKRWNARLNGRANLTMQDIATLMVILPGALPTEKETRLFIDVIEGATEAPGWFDWPDRGVRR